jgi:predicted ATPase
MQETALPTDIRALLVSRLDQLPRRVRDVVQTAAVLGREFSEHHLAAMVPGNPLLHNEIEEAERAQVWLVIRPFQYFFTHTLLRDAAYAMQTHANRVKLHALAIHAMEAVYGDEVRRHYGELAHHAERAAMAEKAFYYLSHAARAAADSYQNSEAVNYYTRALVFAPPDDLAAQFKLLEERVELYARLGQRDLQGKDLNALERWAEQLDDPLRWAQVMFQRATYHHTLGQYLDAVEYAKRADAYAIAEIAPELGIKIQYTWSSALLRLGKPDLAMQQAQVGLQLARRFQRRADEARTLTVMGLIALEQKDPRGAHQYLEASLLTARELKERRLESYALNNLAVSEGAVKGNYALAARHYEEAYRIAREIGDRYQEGLTLVNLGFVAGMQGNFTAAYLYYEDSLLVAREIGNLNQETYTLINMSAVAGLRKEAAQALRFAQQADDLSKKIHDRSAEAWSQLYKGYALLLMEECAGACKAFQESITVRTELGQVHLAMEPRAGLVEAALCTNDLPAASLEAEKILSYLADGGSLDGTEEPLRVYHNCYQYLKQQKDPRAQQVLQAAAQLLRTQVSTFVDEAARRAFIENFPWRRALHEAAQA